MAQRTPTSPGNRGQKTSPPAKKASAPSATNTSSRTSGKPAAGPQPKPAPGPPAKPSAGPQAKPGAGPQAKPSAGPQAKPTPAKSPLVRTAPAKRPPAKSGRSIVQQKQRPWGLILTAVVLVIFAVGIVGYAVIHKSSGSGSSSNPYTQPELADAKAIPGVTYKKEPNHTHIFSGSVKYDSSPPVGGNHSPIWADCSGTVYTAAIANENAVHMLEHGAVWITYKPGLAADQVATLAKLVNGVDRMAMSPYPDLQTSISLQAWGYQLFVDNASDPRIQQFILALRNNPKTTPEQATGVTCSDPGFKAHPSKFGHPIFALSS